MDASNHAPTRPVEPDTDVEDTCLALASDTVEAERGSGARVGGSANEDLLANLVRDEDAGLNTYVTLRQPVQRQTKAGPDAGNT